MLRQYHSELGAKPQYKNSARYNPFIKKWAVRTFEELKGRGIKFFEKSHDGTGRNIYYLTDVAFDKLCQTMDIDQELLFD